MIAVDIPGFRVLHLEHLVLDYNGTLAVDGKLLPGSAEAIKSLSEVLRIHVVTADTFGLATAQLSGLPLELVILSGEGQADQKLEYVNALGANTVAAIGNGRNDRKMLDAVALGIALVQGEGGAAETIGSSDIVALGILDALELLRNPKRLVATLRS